MIRKRNKILFTFGTRPEAIKVVPLIKGAQKHKDIFDIRVCISAQHRQMLDQVLNIFGIKPDYDLDIMGSKQDLFDITTNVLQGLKSVFAKEKPDLIIVQGDTTTAFIAGLAAFYSRTLIGHVEAGLRTNNKYDPFPEEINRHLLSTLTNFHFAPTKLSKDNLLKENVPKETIWITGNTIIDSLFFVLEKQKSSSEQKKLKEYFYKTLKLQFLLNENPKNKLIIITGHRRESFGESFKQICFAIKEIAEQEPNVTIIYPVHLNPNVQKPVKSILKGIPNVNLIEPVNYEQFVFLMNKSYLILTDSGGVQEEGPSLGKPVLVMRNTTERPEGITAGVARLVGTNKESIVKNTMELLNNRKTYKKMSKSANPYGDGKASEKILSILKSSLLK